MTADEADDLIAEEERRRKDRDRVLHGYDLDPVFAIGRTNRAYIDRMRVWAAGLVGLIAVLFAVVMVLLFEQSFQGREGIVRTQRQACVPSLFNAVDTIESDLSQASFKHDAAGARRATGAFSVAYRYDLSALSDEQRAQRRESRLLGGTLATLELRDRSGKPTPEAVDQAQEACRRAYPSASPLSWTQARGVRLPTPVTIRLSNPRRLNPGVR